MRHSKKWMKSWYTVRYPASGLKMTIHPKLPLIQSYRLLPASLILLATLSRKELKLGSQLVTFLRPMLLMDQSWLLLLSDLKLVKVSLLKLLFLPLWCTPLSMSVAPFQMAFLWGRESGIVIIRFALMECSPLKMAWILLWLPIPTLYSEN